MSESARFNGSPSEVQTGGGDAVTRVLEICNKRGLHARASAKFVQTVEKFDADVRVRRHHHHGGINGQAGERGG